MFVWIQGLLSSIGSAAQREARPPVDYKRSARSRYEKSESYDIDDRDATLEEKLESLSKNIGNIQHRK